MSKRLKTVLRLLQLHLEDVRSVSAANDDRLLLNAAYLDGIEQGLNLAIADIQLELDCAKRWRKERVAAEADWLSDVQVREQPSDN